MENELFEKAPIHKAYLSLALPVVFSMVISLGTPIFTLMIALGDIFGLGGSSVISRLFGQKKDEDGKRLSVERTVIHILMPLNIILLLFWALRLLLFLIHCLICFGRMYFLCIFC